MSEAVKVCVCGEPLPMHLHEFMQRGGYTHVAECHCGMRWVATEDGFTEEPTKRRSRIQFTRRTVKHDRQEDLGPNPITGPLSNRSMGGHKKKSQSGGHNNNYSAGPKKQRKSKRRKPQ